MLSSDDGWTLAMALADFEKAGMPLDPARFGITVTRAARVPRIGETRSGPEGGRGRKLYDIGRLQRIHAWLIEQDELNAGKQSGPSARPIG